MAVELADFVDSLKREVTPLGSTLYSGISEAQWTGYLSDAFWEAKLDGFLIGFVCDADGRVEPTNVASGDMGRAEVALIVLYAGIKVLRNQILNTKTSFTAKSGPTEFSQQQSATTLAEMLRQLGERKNQLLDRAEEVGAAVAMYDLYSSRLYGVEGGYHPHIAASSYYPGTGS